MKNKSDRREFLKQGSRLCVACGVFTLCPQVMSLAGSGDEVDVPDPEKLNYCGYTCPPDCPMYTATMAEDAARKKEAFDQWKIGERYGIEFDAEKVFCYGCKVEDKPLGPVVENCTVRKCVKEKSLECCIECSELQKCEQDLWARFPDFHKSIIEMQNKYNEAKAGA